MDDFPALLALVTVDDLDGLVTVDDRWCCLDMTGELLVALVVNRSVPRNVGGRDPLAGTRGVDTEPDVLALAAPTLGMWYDFRDEDVFAEALR